MLDKSLHMQVPSVNLCMRLFVLMDVMQLHNNSCHQVQLIAILKECMHKHKYSKSWLSEEVLVMPLPMTVWRNSSDICLQEGRPDECGAAAKSQC